MKAIGLNTKELQATRKSDPRKQVIAWLVRTQTTVTNRWVSNELNMGHEMNVSKAVRLVEEGERKKALARLKKALGKRLRS